MGRGLKSQACGRPDPFSIQADLIPSHGGRQSSNRPRNKVARVIKSFRNPDASLITKKGKGEGRKNPTTGKRKKRRGKLSPWGTHGCLRAPLLDNRVTGEGSKTPKTQISGTSRAECPLSRETDGPPRKRPADSKEGRLKKKKKARPQGAKKNLCLHHIGRAMGCPESILRGTLNEGRKRVPAPGTDSKEGLKSSEKIIQVKKQ